MDIPRQNPQMKLKWKKTYLLPDSWARDIPREAFGVYVIWLRLPSGMKMAIRVGQGQVYERLSKHRKDREIIRDYTFNRVLATWARVKRKNADGTERWLGEKLEPCVCERLPKATMIKVNLPYNNIFIPGASFVHQGITYSSNRISIPEKLALLTKKYSNSSNIYGQNRALSRTYFMWR